MSYVDAAVLDDRVFVSTREKDGTRAVKRYPAPYFFYVQDDAGKYRTMDGATVRKESFSSGKKYRYAKYKNDEDGVRMWESDVRTEFKLLEQEFARAEPPKLHVAIVDIEVETDKANQGWARFDNPYGRINAITVYRKWLDDAVTIGLCPPNMTMEEAEAAVARLPNTYVVESEAELLILYLELTSDADVTTGWNSRYFDMPYIVARIMVVLGGEDEDSIEYYEPSIESIEQLKKMCLFDQIPVKGEVERYGGTSVVFDFPGTPHVDYLELYNKFITEERFSYKLDYILQYEVGQKKTEFEGTLEELYIGDFGLFCEYNRQDVMGLAAVDKKLGFIDLANEMAHMSCVQLQHVLGSVAIIEQGILLELHERGLISVDKPKADGAGIAGAFVLQPEGGIAEWICSYDINSLYPSVIRMLNLSPETLLGQFELDKTNAALRSFIEKSKKKHGSESEARQAAWGSMTGTLEFHGIADDGGNPLEDMTLVLEDGERITKSGDEWNQFFRENEVCLSANGTVFDTSVEGIIPFCLTKWYTQRKEYQKKSKDLKKQASDFLVKNGVKA